MSKRGRLKQGGEVIHLKKFMNGEFKPSEVHAALALGKRCTICKGPPEIRIKVWRRLDELEQECPDIIALIKGTNPNGPYVPSAKMKFGGSVREMVCISDNCFCKLCKKEAEVTVARSPHSDRCFVEIERNIKDTIQAAVPGTVN